MFIIYEVWRESDTHKISYKPEAVAICNTKEEAEVQQDTFAKEFTEAVKRGRYTFTEIVYEIVEIQLNGIICFDDLYKKLGVN